MIDSYHGFDDDDRHDSRNDAGMINDDYLSMMIVIMIMIDEYK